MSEAEIELVCSARRCRQDAEWGLRWNNPSLHAAEYRKVWLACAEHRPELEEFLAGRGFFVEVVSASELADLDERRTYGPA